MKIFKIVSSLIITLFIVQTNIFSTLTSRIQGTVVDESTNQPLADVLVLLHTVESGKKEDYWGGKLEQKTDQSGKFKFDSLEKGKYFLVIVKEGYGAVGPLAGIEILLPTDVRAKLVGVLASYEGGQSHTFPKDFNTFYLKEGKIKHFFIKLKKEAILIVKKKVKLPDKNFYVRGVTAWITHEKLRGSFEAHINEDGEFRSNYLPAGKVIVEFNPGDEPEYSQEVTLVNGQTQIVEYVDDFTTGTVLHGKVVDKITGNPLKGAAIQLRGQGEGRFYSTDQKGEFWINKIK